MWQMLINFIAFTAFIVAPLHIQGYTFNGKTFAEAKIDEACEIPSDTKWDTITINGDMIEFNGKPMEGNDDKVMMGGHHFFLKNHFVKDSELGEGKLPRGFIFNASDP